MEMDEIINIKRAREFARSFFSSSSRKGGEDDGVAEKLCAGGLRENQIYMLRWCYDTATKWEFDL
jgi:hypothetical protein